MKPYWIAVMAGMTMAGAGAQAGSPTAMVSSRISVAFGQAGAAGASGQDAHASSSGFSNRSAPLRSGMELVAELTKSVRAKKAKAGDKVTAKVIQDVIVRGKIVVRRDSKLLGHVTVATARSRERLESRLGIVFDRIILKDGNSEVELQAVIQALAPPQRVFPVDELGSPAANGSPQPAMPHGGNGMRSGAPLSSSGMASGDSVAEQDEGKHRFLDTGRGAALSGGSHGVIGIRGLTLVAAPGDSVPVIGSTVRDVQLDSGVQIVLLITSPL